MFLKAGHPASEVIATACKVLSQINGLTIYNLHFNTNCEHYCKTRNTISDKDQHINIILKPGIRGSIFWTHAKSTEAMYTHKPIIYELPNTNYTCDMSYRASVANMPKSLTTCIK